MCSDKIYLAPSGVQKERMLPEDLFVVDMDEKELSAPPAAKKFAASQCTPLFFNAFRLRDAGACIHTHSQHAVMATLLTRGNEFRITHQEMIKGIRIGSTKENLKFFDELVVPIIDNTVRAITHTSRLCTRMTTCASASVSVACCCFGAALCATVRPPARAPSIAAGVSLWHRRSLVCASVAFVLTLLLLLLFVFGCPDFPPVQAEERDLTDRMRQAMVSAHAQQGHTEPAMLDPLPRQLGTGALVSSCFLSVPSLRSLTDWAVFFVLLLLFFFVSRLTTRTRTPFWCAATVSTFGARTGRRPRPCARCDDSSGSSSNSTGVAAWGLQLRMHARDASRGGQGCRLQELERPDRFSLAHFFSRSALPSSATRFSFIFFIFCFLLQCYDYLFEIAVKMVQAGLDPAACPPDSEYRDQQRRGVKKQ